ncbi:MAG: HD domain-containing protein [Phycisphaerales bacterium]|nr:HD domain-containing protein [Phycisphaerales bacterium]
MPMTSVEPKLWQLAASYAARAHNHQYRKDKKTPFVAHPFRVAMVLRDIFGCDDEVAICTALLHDTIEDTRTDFDDINKRFGRSVAQCVACMTKNMLLIEPEREKDYDKRLAEGPWQARIVKLADVYDNGMDLPRPGLRRKCLLRCERALALSEADTDHEAFIAARAAVRELADKLRAELQNKS